jgi:hypothetical protein
MASDTSTERVGIMAAEGQRPGTRAEMMRRTASQFALLTDRQSWPR